MMEEAKRILLIGAGGHCLSVIDSLLSSYDYQDIGIIDKRVEINELSGDEKRSILGILVIGQDVDLEDLFQVMHQKLIIRRKLPMF